jgi:hypothetical protein
LRKIGVKGVKIEENMRSITNGALQIGALLHVEPWMVLTQHAVGCGATIVRLLTFLNLMANISA